jgi:hypothetical protein
VTGDIVSVEVASDPLAAVRRVPEGADEALLGVAFVQQRGVNLLERQLESVRAARLVATSVFGSTTNQGLEAARAGGCEVRVLNPSTGTFHPKLCLARHGEQIEAVLGSANLTSGLIANVELVAVLRGSAKAPQLQRLWQTAESWWAHHDAVAWSPDQVAAPAEVLEPGLLQPIRQAVAPGSTVATLGDARPNWITDVTPDGVWVETLHSRAAGRPPQLVEAWMIQVAWDYLQAHGTLTNRFLLDTDGLNVKRSSFVCALLARLPHVHLAATRPIALTLRSAAASASRGQPGR